MHRLLEELYSTAVMAATPRTALARRLERLGLPPGVSPWIIALGKAAWPMVTAATDELRRRKLDPAGGLIVVPSEGPAPHPALEVMIGDHPEPGPRSAAAARALESLTRRIGARDHVWLLLSGGTTSLIAAPVNGLSADDLTSIFRLLLASGLDINAMNRIRKRFARWGGGRLAAALAPARVAGFVVSDVIGDDLAAIASGPCTPDPTTANDVRQLLVHANLWDRLPPAARHLIVATDRGEVPETPKPGDQVFARVILELIASNRMAMDAAAKHAAKVGLAPVVVATPLTGEAAAAGASVAALLLQHCAEAEISQPAGRPRRCLVWGGETTVTLGVECTGLGGRSQELALAAARALDGAPAPIALLAAGTDGRDGPTDAAGAIVDGTTWSTIAQRGRDPAKDLADHDAYHALDAAHALLRPGHTGTNVMDIVVGIC